MCGIIGSIGDPESVRLVFNGLKKLEYRGYDSWGIALKEDHNIDLIKKIGKISAEENIKPSSKIAIGHTRWATHGGVTINNTHPHLDCSGKIAVVHNGIIENYQELKKELKKLKHKFISETDTEILPHLIEENLKTSSKKEALRKTLLALKGNFAIAIIFSDESKIYAAANSAPLCIGKTLNGYLISSDVLPLQNKTEKAIFLSDGTLAEIGIDNIEITDYRTGRAKRAIEEKINFVQEEKNLEEYQHFLFKEINEQPDIIKNITKMDEREISTNAAMIRNSFGTFLIACGTSFHAALVASYLFAQKSKMHINVNSAGEFGSFKNFLTDKTLVIPISQSGETADVLEAVKVAEKAKSKIMSLVNNSNSTLARKSDIVMVTPAGPEIAVLSTKAFTSQIAILYLLSQSVVGDDAEARKTLIKISEAMEEILKPAYLEKIKKLAKKLKNKQNLFTIGRSLNYPTALEAALKIKEVSYIHAEGFAGADLKHGPIALIEKGTPCIAFVANDEVKNDILSNATEIKARGGYIIGVAPEKNSVFDYWLKVDNIPEISPLINILPIQLLAYYLALEKGLDPDKPRNLAKSVTVK